MFILVSWMLFRLHFFFFRYDIMCGHASFAVQRFLLLSQNYSAKEETKETKNNNNTRRGEKYAENPKRKSYLQDFSIRPKRVKYVVAYG